ncbi:MAG: helix-turn-helix domain-containing protein [Bacteroidales bacterium]|nr:helix-turn-helix domain-containing protein [Bacteroidales bacterium]
MPLFNTLRSWRMEKSKDLSVPPFAIFSQKVLYELVTHLPQNPKELAQIQGFGKMKTQQFGEEITEIIRLYCEEQNITPTLFSEKQRAPKKTKDEDTKLRSLELFKQGKTIEEIATARGFAISTIEGHVAHYVQTGELSIHELVPEEKVNTITEYFTETQDPSLGAARDVLGENYSYFELRVVRDSLGIGS